MVKSPIWRVVVKGFNPSTSVQENGLRGNPSIEGTFRVEYSVSGYDNFEGTWAKIVFDDRNCEILLLSDDPSVKTKTKMPDMQAAIREAIEAHFQDTKRVFEAIVSYVGTNP